MGAKQSTPTPRQVAAPAFVAAAPPVPPKCSKEQTEANNWKKNLDDTRKLYEEKRLAADRCSPAQAAARAKAASGPSECQVNDVELNMARNDVVQKDQKWERCNPEEAVQRRIRTLREEATAYERAKRMEQREANENYKTKNNAVNKLADSARELYKTLLDKEVELSKLTSKRENIEQYERRERRAFLDNSPQSGTGGAPGVRTTDDRVLLAFWITYGAAIIAGCILLLDLYGVKIGASDLKSKAGLTVVVTAVAYGLAYYFISFYG